VEDRQPTGLWLELLRGSVTDKRADILADAGLRVSTWLPDPYPARIPQRIDDCTSLLVGETSAADVTASYELIPPADDDSTVVPLRRYPRPSQGICTGEVTTGLLLVLITPSTEDQAQPLRDWADFVHLRHIAAARVPGYTTITPYEHVGRSSPRYCHVYEMTTHDPRRTFDSMTALVSALIGKPGTAAYAEWATHPALQIDYVNTFTVVGAR
jgi:hypothetical protein